MTKTPETTTRAICASRFPVDRTIAVLCACGCGTQITKYDSAGRARRFVSGHNGRVAYDPSVVGSPRRPRSETGEGIPEDEKQWLLELFDHLCAYGCGRPPTQWDHVIAYVNGGSFASAGNAVPACRTCNLRKHATSDPWPWIFRGMNSHQAAAWTDLASLAMGWGALEPPA